MKRYFPSTPASGLPPRNFFQTLALALSLAAGLGAPSRLAAQNDTLPLAANVDQLWLNVLGTRVPISYAPIDSTHVRIFPGITYKQVALKQNGACVLFTEPTGRLRLPSPGSPSFVEVTFYDYVNGASSRSNLLAALRDQAQLGANVTFQPARVLPGRLARLVMSDPAANGTNVLLAEGPITASSSQEPIASFSLNAGAVNALRGLQALLPNAASHLSVLVEQEYEAQFRTIDLQVNLDFVSRSLGDLRQRLIPTPDGRQPRLLFAAQSPLQPAQSGSVDKETQFASVLRQSVRLDVLQRQGSKPNEALVERFLDETLKLVNLRVSVSAAERQAAVGTFLLDDDIAITAALSRLRDVATSIRTDEERKWSSAFQRTVKFSGSTEIRGGVEVGIKLFSGKANGEVINRWDNSDYVDRKREDFAKRLDEASVELGGADIPVLTGIRFNENGEVSSIDFASIENNIGSFTTGKSTLETELPIGDFAQTLGQIPSIEALLVPRMEVGSVNSGHSTTWIARTGDVRFVEIPVAFARPFAGVPQVTVSMCGLGQSTELTSFSSLKSVWNRATTEAINIQSNQFVLRISVAGGWDGNSPRLTVTNLVASWSAVGHSALQPAGGGGLAGFGTLGAPPFIPGEIRDQMVTPMLQTAPQLVDGRIRAGFNAIPGRTYTVEASSDLQAWWPLGTTVADGFNVTLDLPQLIALDWPQATQQFFRVKTD